MITVVLVITVATGLFKALDSIPGPEINKLITPVDADPEPSKEDEDTLQREVAAGKGRNKQKSQTQMFQVQSIKIKR